MPKSIKRERDVWLLLSGGIDSTTCAAFLLEQGLHVRGMFVDYGQAAATYEAVAARAISEYYNIELTISRWAGFRPKQDGLIPGRNAFLLIAALMELPDDASVLALGVHKGTCYPDCSRSFICAIQNVFDLYTAGRLRISAPFVNWSKQDIWAYARERRVPLAATYSCERGTEPPCGKCLSCLDVEAIRASEASQIEASER